MPVTTYYEKIVATMPEGLEKQVFTVLMGHIGSENRISRECLVYKVFGVLLGKKDLHTSSHDRQVRRAIVNLQNQGAPIMSDSGKPGYYLGSAKDREVAIGELVRRRNALDQKIKSLKKASLNVYESNAITVQPSLLEVS